VASADPDKYLAGTPRWGSHQTDEPLIRSTTGAEPGVSKRRSFDFENLHAPSEGLLVTQFITVRSVARSREFYSEVSRASENG
jgi:hypothetical protein